MCISFNISIFLNTVIKYIFTINFSELKVDKHWAKNYIPETHLKNEAITQPQYKT